MGTIVNYERSLMIKSTFPFVQVRYLEHVQCRISLKYFPRGHLKISLRLVNLGRLTPLFNFPIIINHQNDLGFKIIQILKNGYPLTTLLKLNDYKNFLGKNNES